MTAEPVVRPAATGPVPVSLAHRVRRIANAATAHNYGQTVWEVDECGPNLVWLRMSSWPRAQEAARALRAAGFDVRGRDDSPCSLMVSAPVASVDPS